MKMWFLSVEQRWLCCLRKPVCISHAMQPRWNTPNRHKSCFSRKLFPKSLCYIWIGSALGAESLALCEHVSKSSATTLSVRSALLSTPPSDICNWKIGNFTLRLIIVNAERLPHTYVVNWRWRYINFVFFTVQPADLISFVFFILKKIWKQMWISGVLKESMKLRPEVWLHRKETLHPLPGGLHKTKVHSTDHC